MLNLSFFTLRNVLIWIGAWSMIGFLIMGEDKHLAESRGGSLHQTRISERTLHEVALIGGFPRIIAGAQVSRHTSNS